MSVTTVGELIKVLQTFDPETRVVHLSDEEGNNVTPYVNVSGNNFGYFHTSTYSRHDGSAYTHEEVDLLAAEDAPEYGDDAVPVVEVW